MKRNGIRFWILGLVLAAAACGPRQASKLEQDFLRPPASARPWVYWFWLDGNITKPGITADLEAMKTAGIGGVLIMEVDQGAPKGPARFASPAWRELFKFVVTEAARLGLEVNMNNDAGWCGSGGPWITPALAQKKMVWTETAVAGGKKFEGLLRTPQAVASWYRDIAVLAFPTPVGDEVKMAGSAPRISAARTGSGFAAAALMDGNPATKVALPPPQKDKPQFLQLDFARPFLARTLSLSFAGPDTAHGALQASDDGRTFRTIREFDAAPPSLVLNFDDVSARSYRVLFTKSEPAAAQLAVADIDLSPKFRIENILGKAAFVPVHEVLPAQKAPAAAGMAIPRDRVIDLTARMDKDGRLSWDTPEGSWTVLRIGYTPTGKDNHPAPLEGRGLECDKLNVQGADAMFAGLMAKLAADSKPLVGQALVSTHIDSWEIGSQNWTEGFREEFQKRRGYDLLNFLPVMTGRMVDGLEISERFLWDLRQTVSELVIQNYAGRLKTLAHQNGLRLSIEAYDAPCDDMTYAGVADEPMGEFWSWTRLSGSYWDTEMTSAAHVYGQKIVGAEAFTATDAEKWQGHPANIKEMGDWAFCEGINRFVVHRYALQPWANAAPGMSMGPWGLHYERTQTWWGMIPAWHEYLARCQSLLQQGLFVADICCLEPEGLPFRFIPPASVRADQFDRGPYNFDGCTPEVVLTRMSVKDGRLVLPDGMSYRVLVLPENGTMTPALLARIKALVEAGATVIGPRPAKSPSLSGYPACDAEVQKLAAEIWGDIDGRTVTEHRLGRGLVVSGRTPVQVLEKMGLGPDFRFEGDPGVKPRYIHRTIGDTEVYFTANKTDRAGDVVCSFRLTGRRPELWYPDSGRIVPTAAYDESGGYVRVPIHFDPVGSVFVVFRPDRAAEPGRVTFVRRNDQPVPAVEITRAGSGSLAAVIDQPGSYEIRTADGKGRVLGVKDVPEPLEIAGPWDVSFAPNLGAPERTTFDKLISWTESGEPGVKYFSGAATYRKTISVPAGLVGPGRRFVLDLGRVAVMAEVTLNGRDLGVLWKAPFRVDATPALRAGDNALEVKVANLWINRQIGDEMLPEDSERNPDGTLKAWPQWLLDGKPSPTGRISFTSWRLWKKSDPLVESGLLGPVVVRPAVEVRFK
jgi:hypothetical protein